MNGDLNRCSISSLIQAAYRKPVLRRKLRSIAEKLEGGQFRSASLRDIMRDFHGVHVGAYSYGGCFNPGAFPGGAKIGRYVSIADNVVRRLNHPLDRLTLHPFFYNEALGFVEQRTIKHSPIVIEHDAWIGESVVFTESCTRVGIGAVIGAGSVVTRNVDDFEIFAGNPARLIRRRFSDEICERIIASLWWDLPIDDLARYLTELVIPVSVVPKDHPLFVRPHMP